ncbi:MAG: ATP-binding cassette domain-containing protein [Labilithrix sp.]
MEDRANASLASWFAAWHPLYRPKLLQLGFYAVTTGILAYLENVVLTELGRSFAEKTASDDWLLRFFATVARSGGLRVSLVVLATFALLRIGRVAAEVGGRISSATLSQRARADLEATILDHLLRKDDAFFAARPPAEILNRLSSDIGRVIERRNTRNQQRQAIFLIAGNIYFFLREDWRLALAAFAVCAAGAWAMQRLTLPVKEMDKTYLATDDRVKAMFEDYLRASPEAQVADLRGAIRERFARQQEARRTLFLRFSWLRERINVVSGTAYLLAFVSLCVILVYFSEAHDPNLQLALIPVVIKSLPELFTNASQLVIQRLNLQLADTSEKRLLEYDSGAVTVAEATKDLPARAAVEVEDATYRYRTADGTLQGGIVDVSTIFPDGRWTAIVGAAGSGKSTLLQLIVGRTAPASGKVRFGKAGYETLNAADRASIITLMPQSLAILDATIAENLVFARDTSILDVDDFALIEKTGLGAICRTKALTMVPLHQDDELAERMTELRARMRERLGAEGFVVTPFEKGGRDPDDTVIERLASSRADRVRLVEQLFRPAGQKEVAALAETPLGKALASRVPKMLEDTRALLGLSSYAAYAKLAPHPIPEPVWQRRVAVLGTKADLRDLVLVALTSKVREYGDLPAGDPSPFRALLAGVSVPFDATALHPHLTWRDNFVFGRLDAPNSRAEGRIERIILDTLAEEGLTDEMTRIGLAFQVGRGGTRLSGGQRQIIALTRALLRRTPVLVLDEPTSALDPNSRARVCTLLREWAHERVVITVSHDPELVRASDEVRVLEAGRLVGEGPFAELEASSAAFRNVLKL